MSAALLLGALLGTPWAAEPWGPWAGPWVDDAPTSPAPAGAVERLWRAYRARSDQDGAVCPYYPTCSGYARQALRTWGLPVGALLTVDRLLREYPRMAQQDHYPVVTPHASPRLHDPVPPRRGR